MGCLCPETIQHQLQKTTLTLEQFRDEARRKNNEIQMNQNRMNQYAKEKKTFEMDQALKNDTRLKRELQDINIHVQKQAKIKSDLQQKIRHNKGMGSWQAADSLQGSYQQDLRKAQQIIGRDDERRFEKKEINHIMGQNFTAQQQRQMQRKRQQLLKQNT